MGAEKPNPRLFLECVRKAGVPAGECLFIGDSLAKDVRGAMEAGLQAFLYAPGSAREGTGGETASSGALAPAMAVAPGALALAPAVPSGVTALTSFYDLPRLVREMNAANQ